tara:strand:+ start:646 stop:762 length:117 start_codon:yes stop_codon:yes gene_type:complete
MEKIKKVVKLIYYYIEAKIIIAVMYLISTMAARKGKQK